MLNNFAFSFLGNVQLKPILSNAGKDISHWFNPKTKAVSLDQQFFIYWFFEK